MSLVVTTGPRGGVENRLNIIDFVKHKKFFTLYIRALEAMQKEPRNCWTSFFQLGGIHGLPFIDWAKERAPPNVNAAGYCAHGQVLFPTWHRTYVSIYEQIIHENAAKVAKEFTDDQEKWIEAAQKLRQPYWDWAYEMVPPDEVISQKYVEIINYDGTTCSIQNPLFYYDFITVPESFKGHELNDVENWTTTRRYPDLDGNTDVEGLKTKLRLEQDLGDIRSKVLTMLNNTHTWEVFSNHGVRGDPENRKAHANSLEGIHDNIHVKVGLGHSIPDKKDQYMEGHMTIAEVAGFDPIFFLHHANVDRMLSLWHALHPDVWVSDGKTQEVTREAPAGEKVNKDSHLEPFYQTSDTAWTSAPLTDPALLGYSYPEFNEVIGGAKDLVRDAISKRVNELYGLSLVGNTSNQALYLLSNFQGLTQDHGEPLKMYDWTIHASFKKFECHSSFAIAFYFAADGGSPDKQGSYIGSISSFHRKTIEGCPNCKDNQDLVQEGFIHLNYNLALGIKSFDPKAVNEYLKRKQLTYRFMSGNENVALTSLEVTIEGHPMVIPVGEKYSRADKDESIVVYGDIVVHPTD